MQQASLSMQSIAGNSEAKRGSNAADLIIGVGAGKTDRDSEPEIVAAEKAVAEMPESVKSMLGGNPRSLLLSARDSTIFRAIKCKATESHLV